MLLSEIEKLKPGQAVTFACRVATHDVIAKTLAPNGRRIVSPSIYHLLEIPYTVTGRFERIEHTDTHSYAVLSIHAEAAIVTQCRDGMKVTGTEVRRKLAHIPIGCIKRRIPL